MNTRLCVATVLACLLVSRAAAAQDQRALLEVVVNEVAAGETLVLLRGRDAWVAVASLAGAGMRSIAGQQEAVEGEAFVSLASLAPDVTFTVEEVNLRLVLNVSPELLGHRVRDLSQGAPANLVHGSDSSAFVNYSANWSSGGRIDLFTEAAARLKGVLLYNTVSTTGATAVRGLTSLSMDQRGRMRRWTFGDSFGYSGPLGGDAWIGGITVAREFAINPYFVSYPRLSLSTPVALPSVLEVQVNGQVVGQEQVSPGRVDLRNLPLTLGRNDTRIIVRDAFGGTRELDTNFYLTTSALSQGVHDYQYSLGFRRENLGIRSWDYRSPVALGRHRVGVTDSLTLGGRAEIEPGEVVNLGPTVNLRLPVGELEAAGTVSRAHGTAGAASLVAFNYSGRPVSGGGSLTMASEGHATLTPAIAGQHAAVQASLYATASGGGVSITAQFAITQLHDGGSRTQSGIRSTFRMARNVELTGSVTNSRDDHGSQREVYGGLAVLFGSGSASAAFVHDRRGGRMTMDAQRSLPVGIGYGYQVHAEGGSNAVLSAVARYQGNVGRYELRQEQIAGASSTTVAAMGAVVAIGGGVFATRPVQDSFALVKVPGVRGVRAFASNQEVGRTGRNGHLLVPDLQAYYGNILSIADADIPLSYAVSSASMTLATPYRGGAVALFAVQTASRVMGTVRVADGESERIPAYGQLSVVVDRRVTASPLGSDGAFYLENLTPGRHPAVVLDGTGSCEFVLEIPESTAVVTQLGTVRCAVGGGR